jgi:hypothetical protein
MTLTLRSRIALLTVAGVACVVSFQNCAPGSGFFVGATGAPGGTDGYEGVLAPEKLGYVILDGKVFYGDLNRPKTKLNLVEGADAGTFEVLPNKGYPDLYAKDASQAYHAGKAIAGADASSFEIVFERFAKDAKRAYLEGAVIPDVSGGTFQYLGHAYFKDHRSVFSLGRPNSWELNFNRLESAMASSFVVKDGFGVDANAVYCYGKPLPGADPSTFVVIRPASGPNHPRTQLERAPVGKDSQGVFTCWIPERNVLEGADPATFVMFDDNYGKDKSSVYFLGDKTSLDPNTMEILSFNIVRDRNGLHDYHGARQIRLPPTLKVDQVKLLSREWWHDGVSAYYFDSFEARPVGGVDLPTFEAAYVKCSVYPYEFRARDKNRYYIPVYAEIVTAPRNVQGGCFDSP